MGLSCEWQPIATAPRDAIILGAYFDQPWCDQHMEGRIVQCWYQEEFDAFIVGCREMRMANGYLVDGRQCKLHSPDIVNVTHWIAMPPPPQKGRPEGRPVGSPGVEL